MGKSYEEVKFTLGDTVEQAVKVLLSYKDEGKLVFGKFNGVILYSDEVTMDSAYQEITGKTKADFDEYIKQLLTNSSKPQ